MAEERSGPGDPLLQLRQSIASATPPLPCTSSSADTPTENLALATHLSFTSPTAVSFPFDTPTRFISSSSSAVDLRSIFFAWQHKDDPIPDYIASAQALNDALSADGAAGGKVQNLVFVERLDLITWLEGASNDSEYIKASDTDNASAQVPGSSQIASSAAGGAVPIPGGAPGSKPGRTIAPRLQEIYNNERRMGDHSSVLRGIKPTDFSHVRKSAELYLRAGRHVKPGAAPNATAAGGSASLVSLPKGKPSRRPDPIILLSPSASSLLRMSNIKSFLNDGEYLPPDSSSLAASTSILHVSRLLPSIDASRPLRFILVDSPDQFKPDYWTRVVAVFTTGQAWQFKGYKWQSAQELFSHVLGVYVGWRGEQVPETVRGWGRGVAALQVEKWRGEGVGRWRDREVVEGLWGRVEEAMRRSGWDASGPGGKLIA